MASVTSVHDAAERFEAFLAGAEPLVPIQELTALRAEDEREAAFLLCLASASSWYGGQDTEPFTVFLLFDGAVRAGAVPDRWRSLADTVLADLSLDRDGQHALGLVNEFLAEYDRATLDEAIDILREYRDPTTLRLPIRPHCVARLMVALWLRWQDTGRLDDLNEVIAIGEEETATSDESVVAITAAAMRQRAHEVDASLGDDRLAELGVPERAYEDVRMEIALMLREARSRAYDRTDELEHLDEMIRLGQIALRYRTKAERGPVLSGHGDALTERYRRSTSPADRDEAITTRRKERLNYPMEHANWLSASVRLRNLLLDRRQTTEAATDLTELIDLNAKLLGDRRIDEQDRPVLLWNQTTLLWERANRESSFEDLGRAVTIGRELVTLTGDSNPERLSSIGYLIQQWFRSTRTVADLHVAIDLGRRSVRVPAGDVAEQARRWSNLFGALFMLADETGEEADFDVAIEAARAAIALFPDGDPARAQHLNNLASALCGRFQCSGGEDDLDESIRHGREARRTAPDEPERLRYSAMLLVALAFRLDRFDDADALEEALDLLRQAWSPEPHWLESIRTLVEAVRRRTDDPSSDSEVLNALLAAYKRGLVHMSMDMMDAGSRARDLRIVDGAMDVLTTAEAIDGPVGAWMYQALRGQILIRRWQLSSARGELDSAIELLLKAAFDRSAPAQRMAGDHLKDAATALFRRFRRRRDRADLEEAARLMERALALTDDTEERTEMARLLHSLRAHLDEPGLMMIPTDTGEADREDLNSPHGFANVQAWHRGEPRDSGLAWVCAGSSDDPVDQATPGDPQVLFLRTFTADDASYVVLNSLVMALEGGVGRIGIVSDQRDRSEIERHWTAAFGTGSPEERINFVASTRGGWRQEILCRISSADVIVLHVSPKDVDFPEFPFGPPSVEMDGVWERFMDAPLSRPITGPGLLREVAYLNRLQRLPLTIVVCDDRYQGTFDDMIALGGIMGDATDLAGNLITPRLTAIDKQVGHLHKAYRGITYRRREGVAVMPDLAVAIRRALADMRAADLTPPNSPWRPEDLAGRSPTPRRLPPDNQAKIIPFTDVELVLFLPQGEITEIDHREVLTILSRDAVATGCPYCRASIDRMFFFIRGLWTVAERAHANTPDLLARCQICGRKASQMADILMPQ